MDTLDHDRELNAVLADPVGFLRTDSAADIEKAIKLLPYFAYRYQERLAALWESAMSLKEELRRMKGLIICNLLRETDLDTGKNYTATKADLLYCNDPSYKQTYDKWLACEAQRRTVAGYLAGLELKASFIPGSQGRSNRWLEAELNDD